MVYASKRVSSRARSRPPQSVGHSLNDLEYLMMSWRVTSKHGGGGDMTRDELLDVEFDDVLKHFTHVFNRWDWIEVAQELRNLVDEILESETERDSPFDNIFHAACIQAAEGAMRACAAMLGVEEEEFIYVLSRWYNNQDDLPSPISSLKELHGLIRDTKNFQGS